MTEKIHALTEGIRSFKASNLQEVEDFRIKMLGKKGEITLLFQAFRDVDPAQRKAVGALLNELKQLATVRVAELKESIMAASAGNQGLDSIPDLSLPVDFTGIGSRHPLSIIRNRINGIFEKIGFVVSEGPEIEDDWHNFTALNFPHDHPARDMQDTFFIEKNPDIALRTHTSSIQVRVMENQKPPIRTISPGRVFRNEAISARAHCIFHQVEGLYIDKNVSFADMKQTLLYFAREMFGDKTQIRLRPSYFPFTEPSAEMDVSCNICGGSGCQVCKYSGWIEVMGCGMVDPNVLDNCGIDSGEYSGFAFGMGIERIAMNVFQVRDLRMFFENDMRFIRQFSSSH